MRFQVATRQPALAAVILLAAAMGGCAGGASPSGSGGAGASGAAAGGNSEIKRDASGAVNPCALLTPSQIEAAVGTGVVATVPYGDIECRWTVKPLPAFPGSADPWLDVQFWPNDAQMRDVEAAPATGGIVAIDGLGDRAFRTNEFRHLWVKHGTDVFVVRSRLGALGDESETSRAAAEVIEVLLARLVLDQL
jgi:hypothetical protein